MGRFIEYVQTHRLVIRLLLSIMLFSFWITLGMTCIQLYAYYREDMNYIEKQLEDIRLRNLDSLSNSLWNFDSAQLKLEMKGIITSRDIEFIEIREDDKVIAAEGRLTTSQNLLKRTYMLHRTKDAKEYPLGSLTVIADLSGVYGRLLDKTMVILCTQTIKTFLISLFILFILHYLITRHLLSMSGYARRLNVDHLDEPLTLVRRTAKNDELDAVVQSINSMRMQLQKDIAARKETENALRSSEAKYRSLVDNIGIGVALISSDMQILTLNNQLKKWFPNAGIASRPVCYRTFNAPPRDSVCPDCPTAQTLIDGKVHEAISDTPLGGEIKHYRIISSPVTDENGQIVSVIESFEDRTEIIRSEAEKRRLEDQIRQAQKMESLGTLAGGIAHDFNNILGAIIGYCDMMRLFEVPEDSKLYANLGEVLNAAYRAKDLVRQILTFSRKSVLTRKRIMVGPIVTEAMTFLRASLPATIEMQTSITDVPGSIMADPTQIHQVIMNLCTNAAQAMDERGGVLEVVLEKVEIGEDSLPELQNLQPGPYIKLSVADTGSGISPDVLHRIFDPYFTTKRAGAGTGLGLSVVHGIVTSHGGAIRVESRLAAGSTVDVYLPLEDVAEEETEHEAFRPDTANTGHILFVDDEAPLVNAGKRVLEYLGYEVTASTDSLKALDIFSTNPDQFDLVITDQQMPHMAGLELAKEILQIRPGIPIVLCTGYSKLITEESIKAAGIWESILKPLGARQLADLVQRVLVRSKQC